MFGKKKKTKILVHYDAGFHNSLYLRGQGIPGLNWDKGIKMKNMTANEWELEFDDSFKFGEFKVLLNDKSYELGENHRVQSGHTIRIHPKFHF